jgi:energy-coupling factor transporter ATP-binding protein EcfA2
VAPEFIFTMRDVRKVVPPDRVILDEITLYFLPGAKIGVLGANGAGKSSLLRIMAGVDHDFLGEARPADSDAVARMKIHCRQRQGVRTLCRATREIPKKNIPCLYPEVADPSIIFRPWIVLNRVHVVSEIGALDKAEGRIHVLLKFLVVDLERPRIVY